ncbi:hypothetical protein I79_014863 [Cricetulus griseus]|uniref:Fibronectin type-III domain-containing protein n=1 Tax=Cricetulus griseus TaxID=10029 RepID=G3HV85_CRIGR|nr:hypothetical protein I79_014863 [Cricetulus griseus]
MALCNFSCCPKPAAGSQRHLETLIPNQKPTFHLTVHWDHPHNTGYDLVRYHFSHSV